MRLFAVMPMSDSTVMPMVRLAQMLRRWTDSLAVWKHPTPELHFSPKAQERCMRVQFIHPHTPVLSLLPDPSPPRYEVQ